MHDGPAATLAGDQAVAGDAPHAGGASTVPVAVANVKTAKGAHAAGPAPLQASASSVHERPSAHTAATGSLATARGALPAGALIQAPHVGAGAMPSAAAVPR